MDAISATAINAKLARLDSSCQPIKTAKMLVFHAARLRLAALNVTAQLLVSNVILNLDFISLQIQTHALAILSKATNSFLMIITVFAKMVNLILGS